MDPTLTLLLLLAFAFAAVHVERQVLGERVRFVAGTEALVLGVLAGPLVLGLLTDDGVRSLHPMLSVISGFIGFLCGLPVRVREASRLPTRDLAFGFTTVVTVTLLIGGAAFAAFFWVPGLIASTDVEGMVIAAVCLGLGAAVCSSAAVSRGVTGSRAAGPASRVLGHAASVTQVLAILGFGLVVALFPTEDPASRGGLDVLEWEGVNIVAGVAAGMIFHVFVGDEADENRLFVATIGLVALASGIGHALDLSPLFLGLVAGVTVANVSPCSERLAGTVDRLRRPADMLLLVLAGAAWVPLPAMYWFFPVAFITMRLVALRLAAGVADAFHPEIDPHVRRLGDGLSSQGALTAAIAVNYGMIDATPIKEIVTTSLLVSAVVNEIWAGTLLRQTLRHAGETERMEAPATTPANEEAVE